MSDPRPSPPGKRSRTAPGTRRLPNRTDILSPPSPPHGSAHGAPEAGRSMSSAHKIRTWSPGSRRNPARSALPPRSDTIRKTGCSAGHEPYTTRCKGRPAATPTRSAGRTAALPRPPGGPGPAYPSAARAPPPRRRRRLPRPGPAPAPARPEAPRPTPSGPSAAFFLSEIRSPPRSGPPPATSAGSEFLYPSFPYSFTDSLLLRAFIFSS